MENKGNNLNNENNDNVLDNENDELSPQEETDAIKALQVSYEKKLKEQKEFYENKIGDMKKEHVNQIKNILLGRGAIDEDNDAKTDEDKMIENITNNINKYRR